MTGTQYYGNYKKEYTKVNSFGNTNVDNDVPGTVRGAVVPLLFEVFSVPLNNDFIINLSSRFCFFL